VRESSESASDDRFNMFSASEPVTLFSKSLLGVCLSLSRTPILFIFSRPSLIVSTNGRNIADNGRAVVAAPRFFTELILRKYCDCCIAGLVLPLVIIWEILSANRRPVGETCHERRGVIKSKKKMGVTLYHFRCLRYSSPNSSESKSSSKCNRVSIHLSIHLSGRICECVHVCMCACVRVDFHKIPNLRLVQFHLAFCPIFSR
jgi:hypothetical protein